MIRRIPIVLSLCIISLANGLACADEATDKLDIVLREIRNLKSQVQRLETAIDGLRCRIAKLEGKHTASPIPDETTNGERSLRQSMPSFRPDPTVTEVLRLQYRSPGDLLDGIHEREERLRRRQFPPECW